MRRKLGLVVGVLLLASSVSASTIEFSHDGSGLATIGRSGLYIAATLDYFSTDSAEAFDVDVEFSAGRPSSVLVQASGASRYTFKGGVVSFMFDGQESRIHASPFSVDLSAVDNDPLWGGDGPVAMMNLVDITLDHGKLSPSLASALGLRKKVVGGGLSFVVDDVFGGPYAKQRDGVLNWMGGYLDTRDEGGNAAARVSSLAAAPDVPEPSTLALMTAGVGMALGLRRRRRA